MSEVKRAKVMRMDVIDGGGFEVLVDIKDGRTLVTDEQNDEVDSIEIVNPLEECSKHNTRVCIRPLVGQRNEFTIDFSTGHYAFSCQRSQTVRSLESFYQLHAILKVRSKHPQEILKVRSKTMKLGSKDPCQQFLLSRRATSTQLFHPCP